MSDGISHAQANWLRKISAKPQAPVGVEWDAMMICRDQGLCAFAWPKLDPATWRAEITHEGLVALQEMVSA